jgi:hypothetical protein
MSLPRSIDRTDLGAGTVTLTTTAETVVLTGPNLQTPKDSSFVVAIASFVFTVGTGGTGVTARVRLGSAVTGTQVGSPYGNSNLVAAQTFGGTFMVSLTTAFTDYVQVSLTLQQTAATGNGTVTGATILVISF